MTSKFISKLISHLFANDSEIPVSNVIQEVQVLLQTGFCKNNGTGLDAYVPDIYSQETYRRIYQSNFYPVGYEDFWRDAPYNLTFYPPNMNNQWGRKYAIRFREKMDYRNPDSPPRYSRCRMPEHNRKNYNNSSSSNVIF
ncbi:hypothetical protein M9H77_08847 [Catharanthus roseus]|uniref:Uncharacterized protein n=1 Tax=Catharanthus roseus TaxID=4058 RepID=A0ACC0BZ51_CATRO|nr:hypothetical protein M9H77_08847 [Catharanthus roseus]